MMQDDDEEQQPLTLSGARLLADHPSQARRSSSQPTLEMTAAATTAVAAAAAAHSDEQQHQHHHHHHHHQGKAAAKACCHHQHGAAAATTRVQLAMPVEELVAQAPEKVLQAVLLLVRMGPYATFDEILQAWIAQNSLPIISQYLQDYRDDQGHSLLHWAAKRTDEIQFCQALVLHIPPRTTTTTAQDGTGMTALHWACTEPHALPLIRILLRADAGVLEVGDATACTPLLIAAQYGHVETVAYLIQKGANWQARDTSGDTCTHWAAYKGSAAVLGLLAHYQNKDGAQHHYLQRDVYGQTPLHLAALRGHGSACVYILSQLETRQQRELLQMPDANNRTPEQLARHKQKMGVAVTLQQITVTVLGSRRQKLAQEWRQTCQQLWSIHHWQMWLGMSADQDDVPPKLPFYYVLVDIPATWIFYLAVLLPLGHVERGVLWDCMAWHMINVLLTITCLFCLYKVYTTDPGSMQKQPPHIYAAWRRLYETTLEAYAQDNNVDAASLPPLCHTCHVARPPRSKHDRYTKTCVLLFDHHCPFVGNTIGLYNYRYFIGVLVSMTAFLVIYWGLLVTWWIRRRHPPVSTTVLGVVLGLPVLLAGGMLIYHVQLMIANLSSNEHLNLYKYDYLWQKEDGENGGRGDNDVNQNGHHHAPVRRRKYRNPWNHGWWRNIVDRFVPSTVSYTLPHQDNYHRTPGRDYGEV